LERPFAGLASIAAKDRPHHTFVTELHQRPGTAARALEYLILVACRTNEVLGATWNEFDPDRKLWTVPAQRTKALKEHRVPLSDPAIAILEGMAAIWENDYVFPGARRGRPLSPVALEDVLLRMGRADTATVHGLRSSFRDWAGNETAFPREIAEQALASVTADATERAYRRSDALARRRELMDAWARHCEGTAGDNVVTFKRLG
jgi:integrase